MAERVALIGFVYGDEVLADNIRRQTPDAIIDGYEVFPNEAFGRAVDNRFCLYGQDIGPAEQTERLSKLRTLGYEAINLGPIPAVLRVEDDLLELGVSYVGAKKAELDLEIDKTKIHDIFPAESGILPPTVVLESADPSDIEQSIADLGGDVVVKFVGRYSDYYHDTETRRVRMINEFVDSDELNEFIANSIDSSGKVVLQKKINGQQFSYTCAVDGSGTVFRLGENICFKHRYDGDTGPLCDATGGFSVDNSLPFLSEGDLDRIRNKIVIPYTEYVEDTLGGPLKVILNLDLIKDLEGNIFLLEVNNRQPGGHTMANLLSGLETPIIDILKATQSQDLKSLKPAYKKGASVVVSAYPKNFPFPFENDEQRPTLKVPKLNTQDDVRIYTGWVDLVEEGDEDVTVKARLSPTLIFANHSSTPQEARKKVYQRISEIAPSDFEYRTDIGL